MKRQSVRYFSVEDFSLSPVFQFLAQTGHEVEGRTLETPPPDIQTRLRIFATGKGTPEERSSICDLLRTRPGWMRWMVQIVRDSRETTAGR